MSSREERFLLSCHSCYILGWCKSLQRRQKQGDDCFPKEPLSKLLLEMEEACSMTVNADIPHLFSPLPLFNPPQKTCLNVVHLGNSSTRVSSKFGSHPSWTCFQPFLFVLQCRPDLYLYKELLSSNVVFYVLTQDDFRHGIVWCFGMFFLKGNSMSSPGWSLLGKLPSGNSNVKALIPEPFLEQFSSYCRMSHAYWSEALHTTSNFIPFVKWYRNKSCHCCKLLCIHVNRFTQTGC